LKTDTSGRTVVSEMTLVKPR